MRYPEGLTDDQKLALSRGFDHGNYGNAYESTEWESWSEDLAEAAAEEKLAVNEFVLGAALGFFSSYELSELPDDLQPMIAALRCAYDYDACGTCGASLPDDYLRAHPYLTRVRACPDGCEEDSDG